MAVLLAAAIYQSAGLDHILIGVPNLDDGVRAFERATGVAAVRGGRHPSRGTENALVSLGGGQYIELIAPQPNAEPNEFVTQLRALKGPTLVGWAVHVVDADAAAKRLAAAGFAPAERRPGSRVTPQGATLEWTTFDVEKPRIAGAPFFIQWSATTTHPSVTSPGGCTLASFEVGDPDADALLRLLRTVGVKADVRKAARPQMRLTIRCGERRATFD
jgi:Glyoxalase-like domain